MNPKVRELQNKIEWLTQSNQQMWKALIEIAHTDTDSYEEDAEAMRRIALNVLEVDWMFVD